MTPTEDRLAALERNAAISKANIIAQQHALAAIFTAIAEVDLEVASGVHALLLDLEDAIRDAGPGTHLEVAALENITELARTALERGRVREG